MSRQPAQARQQTIRRTTRRGAAVCGVFTSGVGAWGLVRSFDSPAGQQIGAITAALERETAAGFLLIGTALLCALHSPRPWRYAGRALAVIVVGLGLAWLAEFATGPGFRLDRLFTDDSSPFSSRMAPLVAGCFVGGGIGVIGLRGLPSAVSQLAAGIVATVAFAVLVALIFDATSLLGLGASGSVPLLTAVSFLVLAAGIVAARPHVGIVRLLASSTPGGELMRNFLPLALAIPVVLGWLRLAGQRLGWYDTSVGTSLFTIILVLLFLTMTVHSAKKLNRSDALRRATERDRDRAQALAIERAMDLAAIVDASDDAIIGASLAGTIRSWNRGAERLYGYAAAEAIGQSVRMLVPHDRRHEIDNVLAIIASGESVTRLVTERVTKSGGLVDVQLSVSPIRSAAGVIVGSSAVARDITELRQEHERFRQAVEASPSGVLLVDAQGEIVLTNREVERMFGYGPSELIGQPVELLVPVPLRAGHAAMRREFLDERRTRPMGHGQGLRCRRKDGTEFSAEIGLNLLFTRQGPMVLSVVVDVSERQAMLRQLDETAAELKRSNEELTQFAYIASHDLQEPLRMVASFAELLSSRYKGQLDERADKYIAFITEGATRMQQLIRDLLEYARVGTRAKPSEPVDVNEVLARVRRDLRRAIDAAGAAIEIAPLPVVLGDETQIGQLLSNLIGNAVKFRRDVPPRVRISAVRDGARWRFTIEDNGIGIDMSQHDRVFEIFQRLHERGAYAGSGMGLAIVKRIVERHGGRVWFESAVGEGSRFHFTLPGADNAG